MEKRLEFLFRHSSLNPATFTDHKYKKSRYKPGIAEREGFEPPETCASTVFPKGMPMAQDRRIRLLCHLNYFHGF